mmetsp:Transcript_35768/g.91314  ORF Transcript_35768/g.91314 Transcript_35768/m.91314 type:complete len:86 (+) Transcript_35768:233-490(+)
MLQHADQAASMTITARQAVAHAPNESTLMVANKAMYTSTLPPNRRNAWTVAQSSSGCSCGGDLEPLSNAACIQEEAKRSLGFGLV